MFDRESGGIYAFIVLVNPGGSAQCLPLVSIFSTQRPIRILFPLRSLGRSFRQAWRTKSDRHRRTLKVTEGSLSVVLLGNFAAAPSDDPYCTIQACVRKRYCRIAYEKVSRAQHCQSTHTNRNRSKDWRQEMPAKMNQLWGKAVLYTNLTSMVMAAQHPVDHAITRNAVQEDVYKDHASHSIIQLNAHSES